MGIVTVLKHEYESLGGDPGDDYMWPEPIDSQEDFMEARGYYFQPEAGERDTTTLVWRDGDDMKFKDVNNPSGYTLTELAAGSAAFDDIVFDEDGRIVFDESDLIVTKD